MFVRHVDQLRKENEITWNSPDTRPNKNAIKPPPLKLT
jgi:hypothetical protein